jgi:hypothetical protein
MTGEPMTEREAVLAARIRELEGAQVKSAVTVAEGGVFESVWQTITYIVPPWLAALALAVLVAHYGFGYYLQGQVTAAETELQQAKADVDITKSKVVNQPVDGVPMQLATLKAQVEKTRAEAAAAKASATALAAQVNGESVALQKAKAELENTQNQARLKQLEAAAKGAQFDLLTTLEDRAVRAKVALQQMDTIKEKVAAAQSKEAADQSDVLTMTYSMRVHAAGLRAMCEGNQFAEAIRCPSQFIQRNQQQLDRPQVATAPTDDNGEGWKPAGNCLRDLNGFKREAIHGAFAVTAAGDGCGWSMNGDKSISFMRQRALAICAKHGSGCKIISER